MSYPSLILLTRFDNYTAVYELRAHTGKPNEYLKISQRLELESMIHFKSMDWIWLFHVWTNINNNGGFDQKKLFR